jgi:hypothetical protein
MTFAGPRIHSTRKRQVALVIPALVLAIRISLTPQRIDSLLCVERTGQGSEQGKRCSSGQRRRRRMGRAGVATIEGGSASNKEGVR